jgi:DNA-binding transcriptional ArsR family regulator
MGESPFSEKGELAINDLEIRKAKMLFRALNHNLRLQLLQFIHGKKQTVVTDIYEAMDLEQSVTSQHLGILRRAGFVVTQKEGKFVYYSVNYKRLEEVHRMTGEFLRRL